MRAFLIPLLQVLALLIDTWQARQRRLDREKQREKHEAIQSDPSDDLRQRGWLRDDKADADLQSDGTDGANDKRD